METFPILSLPPEKICDVVANIHTVRDLLSILSVSSELRGTVIGCLNKIVLDDGEVLPAALVLSLPGLTQVQGEIRVNSREEVIAVSRQIRGPLFVSGGASDRFVRGPGDEFIASWSSLFNPQDEFLGMLETRTLLYPRSSFRAVNIVKDWVEDGDKEVLTSWVIAYDPEPQALTLNLLSPIMEYSEDYEETTVSPALTRIFRTLPIRDLTLRIASSGREEVSPLLSQESMNALIQIPIRKFRVSVTDLFRLTEYLIQRKLLGLPDTVETIDLLSLPGPHLVLASQLLLQGISDDVRVETVGPIESVKEIIGLVTTITRFHQIMKVFPNLQRATVVADNTSLKLIKQRYPHITITRIFA